MAAAAGVLICVYQRHFVLDWRDPGGFGVVLEHRCGMVMVAAVSWMVMEVGARVAEAKARY
jgi:ABC-type branched-subunit amino acid transport system ATPase component